MHRHSQSNGGIEDAGAIQVYWQLVIARDSGHLCVCT